MTTKKHDASSVERRLLEQARRLTERAEALKAKRRQKETTEIKKASGYIEPSSYRYSVNAHYNLTAEAVYRFFWNDLAIRKASGNLTYGAWICVGRRGKSNVALRGNELRLDDIVSLWLPNGPMMSHEFGRDIIQRFTVIFQNDGKVLTRSWEGRWLTAHPSMTIDEEWSAT